LNLEEQQASVYAKELRELYREEKARAEALEVANRKLDETLHRLLEAERARDNMIANVSHELRTPLTPILGWGKLLAKKDEVSREELEEFLSTVMRNGSRLASLVDSLLRAATMNVGLDRPDLAAVAVRDLFAQLATELSDRPIEVVVEAGAEILQADRPRLLEILRLLTENAEKFSPPNGAIRFRAYRLDQETVLSVEDEGPGVPEASRERIFDLLVQGDGGSTRSHGGVGLGLHLARTLVSAHGGRIWVDEAEGGGAAFRFTVPR
jgi:signal transduction histidine kinase